MFRYKEPISDLELLHQKHWIQHNVLKVIQSKMWKIDYLIEKIENKNIEIKIKYILLLIV